MIGSSVNPALGRVDYSPITRGAESAAQSIQAGGQAYGQMFANLGKQIGGGIEQYQQNKQKRDFLEAQVRSNIGEAIQSMNRFNANSSAYGGQAPIRPEAFENISLGELPRMPIGKLEALVTQTEKLLQKPRAIESFIQQQALTDAANQQRNARIAAAMTPPQANAPFYLGRPMQPDTPEALAARVVGAGGTIQEGLAIAQAPSQIRMNLAKAKVLETPKTTPPPDGYRRTADGNLEIISGGPAAIAKAAQEAAALRAERSLKLQETGMEAKLADAQAEKEAKKASVQSMSDMAKISARATLQEIAKAKIGVNRFAAQGAGSGVAKFFSGSAANDLDTSYDVIGANEALKQIIELKKNSPTGSTGFGALNLQELIVLKSRFAKLTTKSSDYFALRALDDLEKVIKTAYPDLAEETNFPNKTGFANPNNVPKKSRFETISVTP